MAEPLTSAAFATAFTFARSEAVQHRNAAGAVVTAAAGTPAFDHDPAGAPLGLLVSEGVELGGHDRIALDPLMLPAALIGGTGEGDREVTVLHCFDAGSGEECRAVFSRNALATIDALLDQPGHHKSIGVVPGFRPAEGGVVHYRGRIWLLPELLASAGVPIADSSVRPVLRSGAEQDAG